MEQLVLFVKALRALNLSLLFAQGEIRIGHLKPSNAVKNGKFKTKYELQSGVGRISGLLALAVLKFSLQTQACWWP